MASFWSSQVTERESVQKMQLILISIFLSFEITFYSHFYIQFKKIKNKWRKWKQNQTNQRHNTKHLRTSYQSFNPPINIWILGSLVQHTHSIFNRYNTHCQVITFIIEPVFLLCFGVSVFQWPPSAVDKHDTKLWITVTVRSCTELPHPVGSRSF